MPVIGLTGSIAAGKSNVCRFLASQGALTVDADEVSRRVVEPGTEGLRAVAEAFENVLLPDGTLNRRALGDLVFSDEEARNKLNALLHPRIIAETNRILRDYFQSNPQGIAVVEAALLIEAGMEKLCDEIWVVYARDDVRLERLMRRNSLTREQAQSRMNSQMPQAEKLRFADRAIDNSGTREETLRQAAECLAAFKEKVGVRS